MKPLTTVERAQLVHNAVQGVGLPPGEVIRYEATVAAAEGARDIAIAVADKERLEDLLARFEPMMQSRARRQVIYFAAALCADPDGLPLTRAAIQRIAEVFSGEKGDFEAIYRGALLAGGFGADDIERASLCPMDEREASFLT